MLLAALSEASVHVETLSNFRKVVAAAHHIGAGPTAVILMPGDQGASGWRFVKIGSNAANDCSSELLVEKRKSSDFGHPSGW